MEKKLKKLPIEQLMIELKQHNLFTEQMNDSFTFWLSMEKHDIEMAYLDAIHEMVSSDFFQGVRNYMKSKYEDYK